MTTSQPTAKFLDLPRTAFSIDEFCMRNGISRGTIYNYWKAGVGPRFMKVRSRRLISAEAEADWHREREAATAANSSGKPGIADDLPAPMRPLRRRAG